MEQTMLLHPHFNRISYGQLQSSHSDGYLEKIIYEQLSLLDLMESNQTSPILIVLNPMWLEIVKDEEFKKKIEGLMKQKLNSNSEQGQWQKLFTLWLKWEGNLLNAFNYYLKENKVEFIPTTVNEFPLTHYKTSTGIRSQIRLSVSLFHHYFDEKPIGFWLPQAAYLPGIDLFLKQQGIQFTFISYSSFLYSEKGEGDYPTIRSPRGVKLIPVKETSWTHREQEKENYVLLLNDLNLEEIATLKNIPSNDLAQWINSSSTLSRVGFGYLGMEEHQPILSESIMKKTRTIHDMEEKLEKVMTNGINDSHLFYQLVREWIYFIQEPAEDSSYLDSFTFLSNLQQKQQSDSHYISHRGKQASFPKNTLLDKLFFLSDGNNKIEGRGASVLILSWEYPPNIIGGLSRHVYDLANTLVKKGKLVHILTTRTSETTAYEKLEGVHVHRVNPLHPYEEDFFQWVLDLNRAYIQKAHEIIKDENISLIHAHDWIVSISAKTLKDFYSIPLVTTIHATEHGRNQGIYTDLQQKIHDEEHSLVAASDQIIVCSEHMKLEVERLFISSAPVIVIPNGVEINKLLEKNQHEVMKIENGNKPYFFSIGRMVHEKGFETIINVAANLKKGQHDVQFIIAGKGPMLEHYRQMVKKLELEDSVSFIGYISDEVRNEYMNQCKAVIFPSLYEPFGIVALEAMAFKKAVVASETGGLKSVVKHGHTGLLFKPNQPSNLEEQVLRLLEDGELTERLGEKGFHLAKSMFGWDRIAEQTAHVYDDLLLNKKVGGMKG
jgi:1,4-alpha-glucan branching enzyme